MRATKNIPTIIFIALASLSVTMVVVESTHSEPQPATGTPSIGSGSSGDAQGSGGGSKEEPAYDSGKAENSGATDGQAEDEYDRGFSDGYEAGQLHADSPDQPPQGPDSQSPYDEGFAAGYESGLEESQ